VCVCSQENLHDPQEEIESGKEDLKREDSLEPVVKDPVGELAKVSCSLEHMLSQPQLPAVTVLSPVLLVSVFSRKSA
jgi:hypothetical protein